MNLASITTVKDSTGREFEVQPDDRILIAGLYKIYKRENVEVVALRGLGLTVKRGEFVMIVGPSGCGKSTLLNIISGIDKPSAGTVIIDGTDITSLSTDKLTIFRREKIGFIFQFLNLIRSLTAKENVELPLMPLAMEVSDIANRANELLDIVNMKNRETHYPAELSGGEQQRIAVATALANKPSILLADEPTGELDSKNAHELMGVFKNLQKAFPDLAIIMVTHDLSLTHYANRIVKMKDGLVESSTIHGFNTTSSLKGEVTPPGATVMGMRDTASVSGPDVLTSTEKHPMPPSLVEFEEVRALLKHALPGYKFLSEIKGCSTCKSVNLQRSIITTKNVDKPHPLFQTLNIMVICNDCQHAERVQVKIIDV